MFSIIIPVGPSRNAKTALKSLPDAGLTHEDEVILVGDGHEVDVQASIKEIPLRCFTMPHQSGAGIARNFGVKQATKEWILFLDDDDAYLPYILSHVRNTINDNGEFDVWSLSWTYIDGSRALKRPEVLHEPDIRKRNIAGGCTSMVIKRDLFSRLGGFDPQMPTMEDWDLWIRICRKVNMGIRALSTPAFIYDNRDVPRLSTNLKSCIMGLTMIVEKYKSDWPVSVVEFHKSRIAASRYLAKSGSFVSIFRWRAPLASAYFMWRAFRNRRASDASGKLVQ